MIADLEGGRGYAPHYLKSWGLMSAKACRRSQSSAICDQNQAFYAAGGPPDWATAAAAAGAGAGAAAAA